jgi:hypothetical protein
MITRVKFREELPKMEFGIEKPLWEIYVMGETHGSFKPDTKWVSEYINEVSVRFKLLYGLNLTEDQTKEMWDAASLINKTFKIEAGEE